MQAAMEPVPIMILVAVQEQESMEGKGLNASGPMDPLEC